MGAVKGRRKDFWQWTHRTHTERTYKDTMGNQDPSMVWDWMKDTVPTEYARSYTKQIAEEVKLDTGITHNVLICNFPEPRAINTSEPVQLDVIDVDAGVEPTDLLPVTADAGVSAPDGECEE